MRTIAVINQKGGCGKTTTAINLAGVFASRGLRTLLVDVDPQSHCAAGLAIPEQRIDLDIGDAMLEPGEFDPARLLWRVKRNLDLAPSRMKVAGLEASRGGLADRVNKDRALDAVLERLAPSYDACCIDCPPGIGLLTYNALVAADTVLIPVETSYFSLRGAAKQIDTIKSLARRLGIHTPYWLMATIHDEGSALARDLLAELRREFESRVCPVVIRFDASLKEASSFGQSVVDYAPESTGAADYESLATWWLSQPAKGRGAEAQAAAVNEDPPVVHVAPAAGRSLLEMKSTGGDGPPAGGGPARDVGDATDRDRTPDHSDPVPINDTPRGHGVDRQIPGGSGLGGGVGSTPSIPAFGTGGALNGGTGDAGANGERTIDSGLSAGVIPTVIAETERTLSRTEDLIRRATLLSQRGPNGEFFRPAPVEVMAAREAPAPEIPGPIQRLLGVRQTARGILFVQPLSAGKAVSVAGDFNGWSPAGHEMRVNRGLGVFELLVPVPPGVYSYRLVVDGIWKPDPFNPATQPNPFGEANSVLRVSGEPGGKSK